MSVVAFKAQNHPAQIADGGVVDEVDDRRTPDDFFAGLHGEHRFTIDVAASAENAKLPRFFTRKENGLSRSWAGERVWCNPPFSDLRSWVAKALLETETGCPKVVMLLPDNRREQGFWQDLIEPVRDRGLGVSTKSIRGRLKFGNAQGTIKQRRGGGTNGSTPPFGCVIVIFEPCPRCVALRASADPKTGGAE